MSKHIAIREHAMRAWAAFTHFYHSVVFPTVVIGSTLLYIAYYLGLDVTGGELANKWQKPISVVIIIHGLVLLNTILEKKPIELRVLLLNVGWMFLSRCLIGNYTFAFNDECFWAIMLCLMFASGVSLDKKQRQVLLALITIELVAVTSVWGVVAIPTAINHQPVEGFGGIRVITQDLSPLVQYIQLYTYRTIIAAYFLVATGFVLYECFRTGAWFWRVAAAIYIPISFVALALQDCRTVAVGYAVELSTAFVFFLIKKGAVRPKHHKHLVNLGIGALCTVLIYASLGLCLDAMLLKTYKAPTAQASASIAQSVRSPMPSLGFRVAYANEVAAPKSPLQNLYIRGGWWSVFTFSGRTPIWEATIPTLMSNKKFALLGQPEKICMQSINDHIVREEGHPVVSFNHMHNMLLEQLVVAGLPGLILYTGFLIPLLGRIVRVFRRIHTEANYAQFLLGALLLMLLLYGVMEPLLSLRIPITSMLFCIISGVFVVEQS